MRPEEHDERGRYGTKRRCMKKNRIRMMIAFVCVILLLAACSAPLKEDGTAAEKTRASEETERTKAAGTEQKADVTAVLTSEKDERTPSQTAANTTENEPPQTAAETAQPVPRFLETVDLEGQQVFISEVCAAGKLTMVNLWASWCPPCVRELPELEGLYQKYKESGLAVVGILLDAMDGGLQAGKELMQQAGITYLNVLPTSELLAFVSSQYIPVTFFLNEKGEMVGEAVIGADPAAYEAQIKAFLE